MRNKYYRAASFDESVIERQRRMSSGDFLGVYRAKNGEGPAAGDEFGGGSGATGQGLPTGEPDNFLFATGIECSYPTTNNGRMRRDMLEELRHYECWREDLYLVKELGLKYLRYGLPYYKMHLAPGQYDWEFADAVLPEMQRLGITPIMDLLHFGLPDWIGSFQNPELPMLFGEYAGAFAARYPWVRFYTPVNEMFVTARNSGKDGLWNEQLKSDASYVTAIKHVSAASIFATHAIAAQRPDCVIVQSESAEFTHHMRSVPDESIKLQNDLRFLALDLFYGRHPSSAVYTYMLDNGLTRQEYDWFMAGKPPGYQILGNDYYGRNESLLLPDGTKLQAEDIMGWYGLTREYYERYKLPVMHTETNVFDAGYAPTWLWKQLRNLLRMRGDGIPVLGFTSYSLTDQID